jgi:nitrogen PTS system EIIA component
MRSAPQQTTPQQTTPKPGAAGKPLGYLSRQPAASMTQRIEQMQDILAPDAVWLVDTIANKKQLLQELAVRLAATSGLSPHAVFDVLWAREQLGTTGVGGGVAVPHGRIAGLAEVQGYFVRLTAPLEFGALDEQPVDLVFAVLAPAEAGADHLQALGLVAGVMRDKALCAHCRTAASPAALYQLLLNEAAHQAA